MNKQEDVNSRIAEIKAVGFDGLMSRLNQSKDIKIRQSENKHLDVPITVQSNKSAEEILHVRIEAAENLAKKEADKLAKESSLRAKWNDQHIEVQYLITGLMTDFSDLENKSLQSRITQLEKQNAELSGKTERLEKQNSELREALSDIRWMRQEKGHKLSTCIERAEQALNPKDNE